MPIIPTLKFNIPEGIEIQLKDRLEEITLNSLVTKSYGEFIRDILDTLTEWEDLPGARDFIDDKLKSFIIYARDRIITNVDNNTLQLKGHIFLSLATNAVTEKQVLSILHNLLRDDTKQYDNITSFALAQILHCAHEKVKTSKVIIKIIDILQQNNYSSYDLQFLAVKKHGEFVNLSLSMNYLPIGDDLIKIFNYMLEYRTNELKLALPEISRVVEKYLDSIEPVDLVVNQALLGGGDEGGSIYRDMINDGIKKKKEITNILHKLPEAINDRIKDSNDTATSSVDVVAKIRPHP